MTARRKQTPLSGNPAKLFPALFAATWSAIWARPALTNHSSKFLQDPIHKHSSDVHIKVLSGSMSIILGEPLVSSRVQRLAVGSVFVFPAHTWHDEWWDEDTVLEVEGVGPMVTTYMN